MTRRFGCGVINPLKDSVLKQIACFDCRFLKGNPAFESTNPWWNSVNPLKDTVLKQIASLAKFLAKPLKQGYVRASDAGVFQHPQFKDSRIRDETLWIRLRTPSLSRLLLWQSFWLSPLNKVMSVLATLVFFNIHSSRMFKASVALVSNIGHTLPAGNCTSLTPQSLPSRFTSIVSFRITA